MYYDHNNVPSKEDYLSMSRSCTFGRGHKTDFSNPTRGHRSNVSPATYSPNTSTTMKTSALDGFATRCTSPVHSHCRSTGRHADESNRSRRTFAGSSSVPVSAFLSGFGTEVGGNGGTDGGP